MHRHIPALVALTTLAVAGCSAAGGGTGSTGTATTGTTSGSTASTASTASPSTPQPSSPAPATPTVSTVAVGDPAACSLIDEAAAAQVLGSEVTKKTPAKVGDLSDEDGKATKLDGCLYQSAKGAIGYDIVQFDKLPAEALLAMAKAKAGAQMKSGIAKLYPSSVPGAFAYTFALPAGTDSIVSSAKGGWFVTVSVAGKVTSKEGQAAADAAATIILDKL